MWVNFSADKLQNSAQDGGDICSSSRDIYNRLNFVFYPRVKLIGIVYGYVLYRRLRTPVSTIRFPSVKTVIDFFLYLL